MPFASRICRIVVALTLYPRYLRLFSCFRSLAASLRENLPAHSAGRGPERKTARTVRAVYGGRRYYERRKSLRVKSHERSFSKNDEDDCRNPNGALPRPPGFFKAWKHPEEVGKRKSRSTMLRLLRSVAWIFLEWLRPRIAILRFPKQDKVHSFISKSKRGLPSVATWSKLATNFNELDAQNNQEANHE